MKNIISWSGGKDSTTTVILAHEHNIKIDHIIFCEVMFDKKTTGEMPEKMEFVKNKAKPLFEEWGYQVDILHYPKTYIDIFFQIRTKRSKWSGKRIGFPMAGKCYMNAAKREPIKKFYREIGEEYTDYVGIAVDEPERLVKMKQRNAAKGLNQVSLLEKYGYTEEMAMQKCREYDLVSPVYKYSKRDGCWFCPNARKDELRHLRKYHPDLWNKLIELEKEENLAGEIWNTRNGISMRDNERFFAQEEQQMTIFDFIKGAAE
ncbi:adenine nucleotide alpha hydrolase family protein [Acetatifactor aquisgranensis]|uniref:hypothetical protein n=1 Tax=Acetatifactor aquisgranensis TaxID=2941233 RepID=UPI002041BB66|nr:hypothetical protein [Acetatifactor aquisgranensis]